MATYADIMNSGLLYGLVIGGLVIVAGICLMFFQKARKKAIECGVTQEELKAVYKNTIVLTIVPSIAIIIGLFSLSAVIGTPWSWLRLSVIGSAMYELLAAQMTAAAMGYADLSAAFGAPASVFGAVMFVMTMGIILPPITNAIFSKPMTLGLRKASSSGSTFTPVMNACFMIALLSVVLPIYAAKGIVTIMVMLTSAGCSQLFGYLAKKFNARWLMEMNLSLCLIIGMFSSVLWTSIFS